MNIEKLFSQLEEILLHRFLVHYLPGLCLYGPLLSYVFLGSKVVIPFVGIIPHLAFSWLLGVLIERLVLPRVYQKRLEKEPFSFGETINIILSKMGIALALVGLIAIFKWCVGGSGGPFNSGYYDFPDMLHMLGPVLVVLVIGGLMYFGFSRSL